MDKIYIKGLKVFAYHGVNPEEKRDGQEFELDITMYADLSAPRKSDNLEETINYAAARKLITKTMQEKSYDLIERAADEVANRLLEGFTKIEKVKVLLKKPNAPMSCEFDFVGVEVIAER